ncbi:MAG: hypothetical protein EBS05_17430 [Proteobacteria bacterium]|nr:hypothetical protein [Pseudomonadota bacterium]
MSGPKCVRVLPFAPALPLVPALLVMAAAAADPTALANLSLSYVERRKLEARFRQFKTELRSANLRLRALGEVSDETESSLAEISERADALMQAGQYGQALALLAAAVAAVDNRLKLLAARIERRIGELQQRFQELARGSFELVASLRQFEMFLGEVMPPDWPESERARITAQFCAVLATVTLPAQLSPDLSESGVRRLAEGEADLQAANRVLEQARLDLSSEVNRTQSRLIADQLGISQVRPLMLTEWLAARPPVVTPPNAAESSMLKQLDALLVQIGALQDTAGWAELMRRAEEIRSEADAARRRRLYESLALESSARLKQLRATQAWLAEVDALIEEAEPYTGTAVDAVANALRDLRRAGRPEELKPWREQLAAAQQSALAKLERERKRAAILESLTELGYEASEGMETALAQAGKLVIRKPGDENYAIEVVSDAKLSMVQTTMVRYADSPEMTEQQRLRDQEREEEWCADHARWREGLAKQGLATSFKLQLTAGSHPVKVVQIDQRPAVRRKVQGRVELTV